MRADNGMNGLDRFTDIPVSMVMHGSLRESRMRSLQSSQTVPEVLGEVFVRCSGG